MFLFGEGAVVAEVGEGGVGGGVGGEGGGEGGEGRGEGKERKSGG